MAVDDAVPPPIRRSPRAALEYQQQELVGFLFDYDDDHEYEPTPPTQSMPRAPLDAQTSSGTKAPSTSVTNRVGSATSPTASPPATNFSRHRTTHSGRQQLPSVEAEDPFKSLPVNPPVPRRSPARLKSFRRDKRFPAHLRRTSLETIISVTTTHSLPSDEEDEKPDPPEAAAPSPDLFTSHDDPQSLPVPASVDSCASSMHFSSISSKNSSYLPTITPVNSKESGPRSPKAIFKKMTHRRSAAPHGVPDRLIIERTVSFDRSSHRSNTPASERSLPSERLYPGLFEDEPRLSGSSSEWSASSFDTTNLTEAELKKCKKKGINPSLYAEMKAARKGKWTSPIAGNSFL